MKTLDERIRDAEEEQLRLASRVSRVDDPSFDDNVIIGVDVSYDDVFGFACAKALDSSSMQVIETQNLVTPYTVPYISGFFALREAPILMELIKSMKSRGVVMIDSNGILHPRKMGMASYIGVKMNIQTIGVAKTLLIGEVGDRTEDIAPIVHDGEQLGMAIWLGERQHPVYVSIGHRISLESAVRIVKKASIYGNPEPLRLAHICSKELTKNAGSFQPLEQE